MSNALIGPVSSTLADGYERMASLKNRYITARDEAHMNQHYAIADILEKKIESCNDTLEKLNANAEKETERLEQLAKTKQS